MAARAVAVSAAVASVANHLSIGSCPAATVFVLPVDEQHRNLDAMLHEGEERLADLIGQQQFAPAPSGVA